MTSAERKFPIGSWVVARKVEKATMTAFVGIRWDEDVMMAGKKFCVEKHEQGTVFEFGRPSRPVDRVWLSLGPTLTGKTFFSTGKVYWRADAEDCIQAVGP